ncbi:MAG: tRNA threonylcarbamoyladenosine dehydratase [Clostridiales bacterium]|nr:tRNA threonylcarbamoyladenosine dehydratase [Clostridiales bacterium]
MKCDERFSRETLLIGEEGLERLASSAVIVFGAGGVGGYAIEALARAGVGRIDIADPDTISLSNINRQILALEETVGQSKASLAASRIKSINPLCDARPYELFYSRQEQGEIDLVDYDYIIDAIDTVSSKLFLIEEAARLGVPIICSMGTGNKLDPTRLTVSDIYKTNTCPLAAVIRRECRKRNIKKLKVIWSDEQPLKATASSAGGRHAPGSISFVPPVAGMIAAGEVIRNIAAGLAKK